MWWGILEFESDLPSERILELTSLLSRFQQALTIEDPQTRDKETLKYAASLVDGIRASYDWLADIPRERAHELVDVLSPLLEYSRVYESTTAILRCIERSGEVLQKNIPQDEVATELAKTYGEFRDSIISASDRNFVRFNSYIKRANLALLTSSLLNEVTGDLLEKFYVPRLVERMGYQLKSRTVPTSIGDVEVDIRAEKDRVTGFENLEKLEKRNVLIVETKATVDSGDINSLSRKRESILENYRREAEIWRCDLALETWFVACYGWSEELKNLARRLNIIPIDGDELEEKLQEHNLLHRGRPPCRKN
jgi:hypothetical protein